MKLGKYEGPEIPLYDADGSGIVDDTHLESALSKWKCLYEDEGAENPYAELNVWVVGTDVHF